MLNGKPLFKQNTVYSFPEETVAIETLQTSPEVIEALNRKTEKSEGKIDYSSVIIKNAETEDVDDNLRPAVVLTKDMPSRGSFSDGGGRVQLRVKLLANGQVGDVMVYSNAANTLVKNCIDAARKTKFIPAQLDGKPVDSFTTLNYEFRVFIGR